MAARPDGRSQDPAAVLDARRRVDAVSRSVAVKPARLAGKTVGRHWAECVPDTLGPPGHRLFSEPLLAGDGQGIEVHSAPLGDDVMAVYFETPTNPLLSLSDIQAVAEVVHLHSNHPLLVVDNTFATPYLQHPLELGADIVIHSTTKYLGGHSDAVGGAVIVKDRAVYEKLAFLQNAVGAVPGPMDCFLVLRGIKTLPIRMDRHAENAVFLVDFLSGHPKLNKLMYPFHRSHPQVQVAKKQMRNGGGMISFIMQGGYASAVKVAESTKLITLAESLGGVESLIEVPASMTHLSTAGSQLAVDPGLVRLSVGIENKEDILADIKQALDKA